MLGKHGTAVVFLVNSHRAAGSGGGSIAGGNTRLIHIVHAVWDMLGPISGHSIVSELVVARKSVLCRESGMRVHVMLLLLNQRGLGRIVVCHIRRS